MRTLSCLPLTIALISATAFAAPQTEQIPQTLGEIQVRAVMSSHRPTSAQIDEVKGTYAMDNGAYLTITQRQSRMYAQLDQRPVTELVAIGENRFISPDQRMTLEYQSMASADQVLLTYPADASLASSAMITVRLAAR